MYGPPNSPHQPPSWQGQGRPPPPVAGGWVPPYSPPRSPREKTALWLAAGFWVLTLHGVGLVVALVLFVSFWMHVAGADPGPMLIETAAALGIGAAVCLVLFGALSLTKLPVPVRFAAVGFVSLSGVVGAFVFRLGA